MVEKINTFGVEKAYSIVLTTVGKFDYFVQKMEPYFAPVPLRGTYMRCARCRHAELALLRDMHWHALCTVAATQLWRNI